MKNVWFCDWLKTPEGLIAVIDHLYIDKKFDKPSDAVADAVREIENCSAGCPSKYGFSKNCDESCVMCYRTSHRIVKDVGKHDIKK